MRKEVLIAIIAGLLIGLTIAFGSWRINKAVKETPQNFLNNKTPEEKAQNVQNTQVNNERAAISYSNLEDYQVLTSTPYKINGITKQNTIVAISGETKDIVLATSLDGTFQHELDLTSGINQLLTSVFDENGNQITNTAHVMVYSSELAKFIQDSSENTATQSAESTLDKVKQKVETIRKNPKAIVGTVTDKTENSLQLKNLEGKIELVSVSDDTTYAKGDKNAAFSDVAIGDFLAVLGFANGTSVHEAIRVLLISPISEPTRKIVSGEVVSTTKKDLTLNDSTNNQIVMTFPKKWVGPEIKNIQPGMKVIAVYNSEGSKPTIRTIQILESAISPSPTSVPSL